MEGKEAVRDRLEIFREQLLTDSELTRGKPKSLTSRLLRYYGEEIEVGVKWRKSQISA